MRLGSENKLCIIEEVKFSCALLVAPCIGLDRMVRNGVKTLIYPDKKWITIDRLCLSLWSGRRELDISAHTSKVDMHADLHAPHVLLVPPNAVVKIMLHGCCAVPCFPTPYVRFCNQTTAYWCRCCKSSIAGSMTHYITSLLTGVHNHSINHSSRFMKGD